MPALLALKRVSACPITAASQKATKMAKSFLQQVVTGELFFLAFTSD